MGNKYWKEYNPHPKGKFVNDCVKRAACAVTGWDYMEVQRGLNRAKKEYKLEGGTYTADSFRNYPVYNKYYNDQGWKKHKLIPSPSRFEESKVTGKSFCDEHPKGKYILQMPNHVVGCIDGVLWDTHDTSDYKVSIYWTVEEPEEEE